MGVPDPPASPPCLAIALLCARTLPTGHPRTACSLPAHLICDVPAASVALGLEGKAQGSKVLRWSWWDPLMSLAKPQ